MMLFYRVATWSPDLVNDDGEPIPRFEPFRLTMLRAEVMAE